MLRLYQLQKRVREMIPSSEQINQQLLSDIKKARVYSGMSCPQC